MRHLGKVPTTLAAQRTSRRMSREYVASWIHGTSASLTPTPARDSPTAGGSLHPRTRRRRTWGHVAGRMEGDLLGAWTSDGGSGGEMQRRIRKRLETVDFYGAPKVGTHSFSSLF
jgi:hypothetical protein